MKTRPSVAGTTCRNNESFLALDQDWRSRCLRLITGWLLIGWLLTSVPQAGFAQAGLPDPNFVPATDTFDSIQALVLEPAGSVLAAGYFGAFSSDTTRGLVRLDASGAFDATFNPGAAWGEVLALARQADGKILVGGFGNSTVLQNRIARLNPDGSPDLSFNSGSGVGDNFVSAIAVQTNGQIVIAGAFQTFAGVTRLNIARLNANGSLDASFNPGTGVASSVQTVAVQPDGKILAGGFFGSSRRGVVRLNTNGTLDAGFTSALDLGAAVTAQVLQSDGKLVVSGNVPVAGVNRGVVRLNSNGSRDSAFDPGSGLAGQPNAFVAALALQADGKILVGGGFSQFSGVFADSLVRLNTNGTLDLGYDPGTFGDSGSVLALAAQPDGKSLAGGSFIRVAELPRNGMVRLLEGGTSGYAGRIRLSAAHYSLSETGGVAHIVVERTRSSNGVATVRFDTSDGTGTGFNDGPATAGADYVAQSGTLAFTNGQTNATFSVPIIDDNLGESSENISLKLSQPGGGAVLGQPSAALLTILDNDSAFEFDSSRYTVNEVAGQVEVFVLRQGVNTSPATVQYATLAGSATAGVDFTSLSGTLTFEAGQSFARLSVPILDDSMVEGTESFGLSLSNPSAGNWLNPRSNAVVTILDNDDDGPGGVVTTFNPAIAGDSYEVSVRNLVTRLDGDVFITGNFNRVDGVPRNRMARLHADGSLVNSFNPDPTLGGDVLAMATEADGGVLLGGGFFAATNNFLRNGLVRLRADGLLDTNFDSQIEPGGQVYAIAKDSAGRRLVAGVFSEIGGANRTGLARLGADGRLDISFNPVLTNGSFSTAVGLLAPMADGRILIAGTFSSVNGISRQQVARLNSDGSLDESFSAPSQVLLDIRAMVVQPDGKVVLGGSTPIGASLKSKGVVRLNTDGSLDGSFTPVEIGHWDQYFSRTVSALALQPDGRIVVGGKFGLINNLPRNGVGRLNADGSLDRSFDTVGTFYEATANALAIEASGDVLAGGYFRLSNGDVRSLVRLRGNNPNFIGRFEFAESTLRVWETNALVNITVQRHGVAPGPATVHYAATDGGASNGMDFVLAPGTLEFAAGETSKTLAVTILADGIVEPPENFTLTLSEPVGAILGSQTNLTLTIVDHPGGLLDESFDSGAGPDNWIFSLLSLPGGKFLARGQFTSVNGMLRRSLARFNPDGSLDQSFDAQVDWNVISLAACSDGKVYVCSGAGLGVAVTRHLADGARDPEFLTQYNTEASAMVVQADGKLVFNRFTYDPISSPGSPSNHLFRLNKDGSLDPNFNPGLSVDGRVGLLKLQADGRILVGGTYSGIGGITQSNLARLNLDGSVDFGFAPAVPAYALGAIALQPDGKILIGGSFTEVNYAPVGFVARLQVNGTLDVNFGSPFDHSAYSFVNDIQVQADGRILVAGDFSINGYAKSHVLRLEANGAVDLTFDPAFSFLDYVDALLLQADGRVIAGGSFDEVNGIPRRFLARLLNDPEIGGGNLEFASLGSTVNEANSSLTVAVRRTDGRKGEALVRYSTIDGEAVSGADYIAQTGVVTFADGDSAEKLITVRILNDTLAETAERFTIGLASPIGGAVWGMKATTAVTITDDDVALQFATNQFRLHEGIGSQMVEVRRFGNTTGVVSVDYATSNGTAQAGLDYVAQSGSLIFSEGETNKSFQVPIIADKLVEENETVLLTLRRPTGGARLGTNSSAVLTIADDDRPGTLDSSFNPGTGVCGYNFFGPDEIHALALQSDGRLLVGGNFAWFNGVPRSGLARLLPDGSLDGSFVPLLPGSVSPWIVNRLLVQPDGNVLVVASDGFGDGFLLRLDANGIPDPSFSVPNVEGNLAAVALQPDGKIIIGGYFNHVNVVSRHNLARLNSDGALDVSFVPDTIASDFYSDQITCLALDANGKVLVGGAFGTVSGVNRCGLARLTANGSLDETFDPGTGLTDEFGSPGRAYPNAIVLQPDGKLVVGGNFARVNASFRTNIARLNPNGTLDPAFTASVTQDPNFGIGVVSALALQPDGQVIVGGSFTSVNGVFRNGIARLNPDGSLDGQLHSSDETVDFSSPSPFIKVYSLVRQPDGQIIIAGQFQQVDGEPRCGIARLNGTRPTPSQAVEEIIRWVNQATLPGKHKRPLLATLQAALASFDRGNMESGINQLRTFQNKVLAQIASVAPDLAAGWMQAARAIIDAIQGQRHGPHFTSIARQPHGKSFLKFTGLAGRIYFIQATTNMTDWITMGRATDLGNGSFEFEDADSDKVSSRFYRVLSR